MFKKGPPQFLKDIIPYFIDNSQVVCMEKVL
jgi:hypothetical protein